MAAPEVAIVTVTSAVVATDKVAVKVKTELEFSSIEVPLVDRVTVGALSFSSIVSITACVPLSVALPPETPVIETVAVSSVLVSYKLSSVGVNDAVPVVSPEEIVISEIVP